MFADLFARARTLLYGFLVAQAGHAIWYKATAVPLVVGADFWVRSLRLCSCGS